MKTKSSFLLFKHDIFKNKCTYLYINFKLFWVKWREKNCYFCIQTIKLRMNKIMGRICILVTMATFWIAFILLSSVIVLCELILLWKAIERSRNSENKTTEKRAVSYLFVHRRFKVRLFTSQVFLIFHLLLKRKIVFKDHYIIMQIRFRSHEWTVLRERPRRKTTLQFWVVFGWQVSLWGLKTEPCSIPSDKKLKPAQHISNLLFPVEVSQYWLAKLRA